MTARDDIDLVLADWMASSAHVAAPEGLHGGVVRRVRSIRQRPAWLTGQSARGFGQTNRAAARRLTLVAAVAAVAIAGVVWSVLPGAVVPDASESPVASPTEEVTSTSESPNPEVERAERFFPPFDYVIPEGSGLAPLGGDEHTHVIRWVANGMYGITVAAGQAPWAHGRASRFVMSGTPAEVMEGLQERAGLELDPITPLELDGMPALAATVDDKDATDIHVGNEALPYVNYFKLNEPSLLITSSVDGNVFFITIWARTVEERDAFLPTAMEFVESIDFVEPPDVSTGPPLEHAKTFVLPFDFRVPDGSGLVPADIDGFERRQIAWVVGEETPLTERGDYGGQKPRSGVDRGIIVAASEHPWAHGTGRYRLRTDPRELLDDLGARSGAVLSSITPVRLDGVSAVAATVEANPQNDIHITGALDGPVGINPDAVELMNPTRLIVANIRGQVVFVLIWARTADQLDAFLPAAMEFVGSIQFRD